MRKTGYMLAKGTNGSVELHEHHIVIKRKGVKNALRGLRGDKSIPLSSVTSVQFRPVSFLENGRIRFSILGGSDFKGGYHDALNDENTVFFSRSGENQFATLRDAVQNAIQIPSLAAIATQYSQNLRNSDSPIESSSKSYDVVDVRRSNQSGDPNLIYQNIDKSFGENLSINDEIISHTYDLNIGRNPNSDSEIAKELSRGNGCIITLAVFFLIIFVIGLFGSSRDTSSDASPNNASSASPTLVTTNVGDASPSTAAQPAPPPPAVNDAVDDQPATVDHPQSCNDIEAQLKDVVKEKTEVEILEIDNVVQNQDLKLNRPWFVLCSARVITDKGKFYASYGAFPSNTGNILVGFALAQDPVTAFSRFSSNLPDD